jgi:hypothetical protein
MPPQLVPSAQPQKLRRGAGPRRRGFW